MLADARQQRAFHALDVLGRVATWVSDRLQAHGPVSHHAPTAATDEELDAARRYIEGAAMGVIVFEPTERTIMDVERSSVPQLNARVEAGTFVPEILAEKAAVATCPGCGEPLLIGSWPFCKSARNPKGHSTERAYGFSGNFR